MRRSCGLIAFSVVVVVLLSGCAPPEDTDLPRPTVTFEGRVDPDLKGRWETADRASTLELDGDGGLTIDAVSPSPKGPQASHRSGQWRVSGDRLLMRYRDGDGSDTVIGYTMKRTGNTLTLSTKSPKRDTRYTRRSPR